jgi:hypothetical protein
MKMPEPKRYDEITVMPDRIDVNHVHDYRGSQNNPVRPAELECDYCCTKVRVLWCRYVRPFGVQSFPRTHPGGMAGSVSFDGGTWNACVACEPFVEQATTGRRSESGSAGQRAVVELAVQASRRTRTEISYFGGIYCALFDAMPAGAPVVWRSGDVFPVTAA